MTEFAEWGIWLIAFCLAIICVRLRLIQREQHRIANAVGKIADIEAERLHMETAEHWSKR